MTGFCGSFEDQRWIVAWTWPDCEHRVWRKLGDLDLQPYLPRIRAVEVRNGRKVELLEPRFEGYVFALADAWRPEAWDAVHAISGLGGLLRQNGGEELAIVGGMQLASAILVDVLEAIRMVCPNDPLFVSRRRLKREMAWKKFVERSAA